MRGNRSTGKVEIKDTPLEHYQQFYICKFESIHVIGKLLEKYHLLELASKVINFNGLKAINEIVVVIIIFPQRKHKTDGFISKF